MIYGYVYCYFATLLSLILYTITSLYIFLVQKFAIGEFLCWIHHWEYVVTGSRLTAECNNASESDRDVGSQFSVHVSPAALPPAEMRPPPSGRDAAATRHCSTRRRLHFCAPPLFSHLSAVDSILTRHSENQAGFYGMFGLCLPGSFSFRQLLSRFPRRQTITFKLKGFVEIRKLE